MGKAYVLGGQISCAHQVIEQAEMHADLIQSDINIEIALLFATWLGYMTGNRELIQKKTAHLSDSEVASNEGYYLPFTLLAREWALKDTTISREFSTTLLDIRHILSILQAYILIKRVSRK